ncbi:DUF4845 domain-containing protein [Parahaliea aestuarii]|uniref:DUF4845 domain-containing protein n=1 Tax=Parahaliea aestuarii TaxID=1852021 RepID=A0A5C8ZSE3_9GAMM|nr:DUF4845 domain-containing protein [Parahaliea aestuarii]TXS91433.1 DUF4845 domain-containing protein [Parahaliea aestuarii]
MKLRQQQSGMSLLGMLCVAIMIGFFVMCLLKMGPSYFEYLSVKEIMSKVSAEYKSDQTSIADIRRRIANLLNTNQIYGLKPQDVEVFRKEGKTYIDASYEVRIPVMWRIDAMFKFDDLKFEAGRPEPLPPTP